MNESSTWETLGLSLAVLDTVKNAGYLKPTPIQIESIPVVLQGTDVLASAQTGTGKTACFVLPMVEKFIGKSGTYGLVLAPTREMALQIHASVETLGGPLGVRSIALIGGVNMRLDDVAIQTYPQIIVATPGRLCDHLDRGNIWLDYVQVLVLDEADRMLDMGFSEQLSRVVQDLPKERQTLLFSATMPPSVQNLAKRILHEPKKIAIGGVQMSAANTVEQRLIWMLEESKTRELEKLLKEETGSIIVFVRSKDGASRVWRSLHSRGVYDATQIHSDKTQAHRELALNEFKQGKYRILIATDVVGRGIHVDDVAHVVNYDIPLEAEDFVHRIGRTGRRGTNGKATSFATPRDLKLVKQIESVLKTELPAQFRDGLVLRPKTGPGAGSNEGYDQNRRGRNTQNRSGPQGRGGSSRGGSSNSQRGVRPSSKKIFDYRIVVSRHI